MVSFFIDEANFVMCLCARGPTWPTFSQAATNLRYFSLQTRKAQYILNFSFVRGWGCATNYRKFSSVILFYFRKPI